MLRHREIGFFTLLALVLVMALGVATPMATSAGDKTSPGNSAVAKLCQKDGWTDLARAESPDIAFASEEECVSFGAEGGTIVPLEVSFLTLEYPNGRPGSGVIHGEGLQPGAPLMFWGQWIPQYGSSIIEHQWYGTVVSETGVVDGTHLGTCGIYAVHYFYTTDVNGNRIETAHFGLC